MATFLHFYFHFSDILFINESILHVDFFAFFPFPIFPKNGNVLKVASKNYSYKNQYLLLL